MTSKDFFEEAKYEWCASEHQDKPLLNDMMRFAKLYHKEQLILSGVSQQRELLFCGCKKPLPEQKTTTICCECNNELKDW